MALGLALAPIGVRADAAPRPGSWSSGDGLSGAGTVSGVTATARSTTTLSLLWSEIVAARGGGSAVPAMVWTGEGFAALGGTNRAQSGALAETSGGLCDWVSASVAEPVAAMIEDGAGERTVAPIDGGPPQILAAALAIGQGALEPESALVPMTDAGAALADLAAALEASGSRTVLVGAASFGNFPLLGGGQGDAAALRTAFPRAFNEGTAQRAEALGLGAVGASAFAFFDGVIADPEGHGLTDARAPTRDGDRTPPMHTRAAANGTAAAHALPADHVTARLREEGLLPADRRGRRLQSAGAEAGDGSSGSSAPSSSTRASACQRPVASSPPA